jgi:protease I
MAEKGRIACLLATGFEDSEFRVPYDRLREAGYLVEIVGVEEGKQLLGYRGREKVKTELSIDEADVNDYDGLLIPGGQSPEHLRINDEVVKFVKDFNATGKPIAAVCHGPQLLLSANLVKGRTMTAWPTVQGDLAKAGADVRDDQVVIDHNWITSRKPEDLEVFSRVLVGALNHLVQREQVGTVHHPAPDLG